MSKKGKPKITENTKGEEWTKITFTPDLKRFSMENIDEDTFSLLSKRVYDMAGTIKGIKVHLNGERIKINGFKQVGISLDWLTIVCRNVPQRCDYKCRRRSVEASRSL